MFRFSNSAQFAPHPRFRICFIGTFHFYKTEAVTSSEQQVVRLVAFISFVLTFFVWAIQSRSFRLCPSISRRATIAKNQNTYAKKKREMEKKAKAEAKRIRRIKRKQGGAAANPPKAPDVEPETPDATN